MSLQGSLAFGAARWPELLGYAAAFCTLLVYSMKTMIPLRIMGIASNCFFLGYGYFMPAYPQLILHSILLPLNVVRLYQMIQLVKKIEVASKGDLSMDWLKPFMTQRACRAGEVLFRKSDVATNLYYTLTGRYRLEETGTIIPPGEVVGEIAFAAPEQRRTQTFKCLEDGELLTISYPQIRQLYFQNPKFGFYLLQLTSHRLLKDVENLESALARTNRAADAKGSG